VAELSSALSRRAPGERAAEETIISVERAFLIVELLADTVDGLSLADISRHLDVNKAIGVKLLGTLQHLGWSGATISAFTSATASAISGLGSCRKAGCLTNARRC